MIRHELQIHIHRPPEAVFDFVSDPANAVQWMGIVEESAQTSEGPLRTGSTFRQLYQLRGEKKQEMRFEVVEYVSPQRYGYQRQGGKYPIKSMFEFTPQDGGTLISYNEEAGPDRFLANLVGRLVAGTVRRQLAADLARLKTLLEESEETA